MRKTSRAANPAWYQSPLELSYQLHVIVDGPEAFSFHYDRPKNLWSKGPLIRSETLLDSEQIVLFAADVIQIARTNGATSLGIILYIGDEFATAELKSKLTDPDALGELRETAYRAPHEILDDTSLSPEEFSWRVVPYPAAKGGVVGTAIALSRQYVPFLDGLRTAGEEANFPVVTQALSAPLVALAGIGSAIQPTEGKPFVSILQYPWFTVMAFFNEHFNLRLVRTVPHRGVRKPTNFRNTLITATASLEIIDPDLYVVALGDGIDTTLAESLRTSFPQSRVESIELPNADFLPPCCPEPAILVLGHEQPGIPSQTFSTLLGEGWASQDFLPVAPGHAEIFPGRKDMKLLRFSRFIRAAAAIATLGTLAFFAWELVQVVGTPEWAYKPSQAAIIQGRLAKFSAEKQNIDHWENLLADRSKTWSTMETLVRMFPENQGILIKDYGYSAKPNAKAGLKQVGFIKEWRISGLAHDNARETLNALNNREGINEHFALIAKITGDSAFDPALGNRSVLANVRTSENRGFKPIPLEETTASDESSYPYAFELRITQRFEANDPLALTVGKAP